MVDLTKLESSQSADGRQLMVVDDEPQLLQSLVSIFQKQYMVVFAESGDQALELLRGGFTPQVILSDNRMPGISGIEFLAQSTKYVPDAVRVIMTGFTELKDILAAINQGHVYMYLTKPWQIAELLQSVRICFQHYGVTARNKRLAEETANKNVLLSKLNEELSSTNRKLADVNKEIYGDLLQSAQTLGTLLGEKEDYYYTNHADVSAKIARAVTEVLGIDGDKQTNVIIAAILHDIGKVGLPRSMMTRPPGSLTGNDLEIYKSHVTRGADLLRHIQRFSTVADIVAQHHERIDGTGFPLGLSTYQVLREAQIINLADTYHDMVYRIDPAAYALMLEGQHPPLGPQELAQRHRKAEEHFLTQHELYDPEVYEAFRTVVQSGFVPELNWSKEG